ncbi:hypothetical protein LINPERHAP2_LOCUS23068 [Linum perenne]
MTSSANLPRRDPPANHNCRPLENISSGRPPSPPLPPKSKSYSSALSGALPDQPPPHAWICVGENDFTPVISNGVRGLRLSREFKEKLCKPWSNTVVIRLIGKSVGYSYLYNRLKSMWKPSSSMQVIDVDLNFYIVRFGDEKDYFRALTGGPWCVEYENLPELCFSCGEIGHGKGSCPSLPQTTLLLPGVEAAALVQEPPPKHPSGGTVDDGYGPWLTVTRSSRRSRRDDQPRKETFQKGKPEDSSARSKADGISGKSIFGKTKESGEGSAPQNSSHAKEKEKSRPAFNALKGRESKSANGSVKSASKKIGTGQGSDPKAQATHSTKASIHGKG